MSFTKVAPAGIGTEPGDGYRIGNSFLHATGLNISGIVTATQGGTVTYYGDGSNLEGVSSSGIGTPLSDDDTSDLNKIYYANQELVIDSTVTVNHPDTGIAAYTHYQDLVVKDNADFIVADGDTFIPDVLGINTSSLPNPVSSATGGRIRAGTITNAGANGAVNFPNGLTGTAGTFTGNLNVAGVLTYEDVTNVDSVGVITARSGIDAASNLLLKTGGTERLRIDSSGRIGINTTPSHSFELFTGADHENIIQVKGTNSAGVYAGMGVYQGNAVFTGGGIGSNSAGIVFRTAASGSEAERLRVGPAGQLGIGGANYGTSGQVLKSQGASSAVAWASLAVGKFASYAVVADANNQGNQNGGTFTQGAWRTRILDTEITDEDNIVSLSSNQFTLGAGNYFIIAWASALDVDGHQARLRDITNGATRAHGSSEYTSNSNYVTTKSWIFTRITPSSSTAYELQHRCQTTGSNVGFGNGSGDQWTQESNGDTYCMVIILKEV